MSQANAASLLPSGGTPQLLEVILTSNSAIQLSWLCIAYPCLLLAYIGQAAFISEEPEAYSNPFFKAAPPGTFWPSLVISILAAIVASQALITSTFQLLFQVVNMSYFPPISMHHTSRTHHTQVYIPMANWLLMIGTIAVTAAFKNVRICRPLLPMHNLTCTRQRS